MTAPKSGLNNAAEYSASGLPFVTTSLGLTTAPIEINFPFVTNGLHFNVSGSIPVRVGFTFAGINGTNYFAVKPGDSPVEFDIRCKKLYIRSDTGTVVACSIMAGLTQIEEKQFPILTGSAVGYSSASIAREYGYSGLG
jgi:hypothetical protein